MGGGVQGLASGDACKGCASIGEPYLLLGLDLSSDSSLRGETVVYQWARRAAKDDLASL